MNVNGTVQTRTLTAAEISAGQVTLDSSGVGTFAVSWPARSAEPAGVTSPEELIAAAHAGCFSMALAKQ